MERLWLFLAFALAGLSLGPGGFLGLLSAILAFFAGSTLALAGVCYAAKNAAFVRGLQSAVRQSLRWSGGGPVVATTGDKEGELDDIRSKWARLSLTGFRQVDRPLELILGYVLRDYVYPWHFRLTHDESFPVHLEDSANHLVSNLSAKVKSVDWIPYLTTRLVDDVASHVRLFKRARLSLKEANNSSAASAREGKIVDLESLFFDAEVAMESASLCRDLASSIQQEELNYLQSVAELLLFLLLPEPDFAAGPLRLLAREILANVVLKPTLDLVSDPDFINQTLVWLCKDYGLKHDVFVASIRHSENLDEVLAVREAVTREISYIRSNDSKGELDSSLKQQLGSLLYLRKVVEARLNRLQSGSETDSTGLPADNVDYWNRLIEGPAFAGAKLFDLPIDVTLKNSVALSYFIDYMTSIGCQAYLFFYLNAEGWKVSAETQLEALELEDIHIRTSSSRTGSTTDEELLRRAAEGQRQALSDNMREAAHSIYEEYLSEKATTRLLIDESVVKRLLFKIRTEPPDSDWFGESHQAVYDKLRTDDRFHAAFKRSVGYVRLLAELDLLKDSSSKDDDDDDSDDSVDNFDGGSLNSDELVGIYDSHSVHSTTDSLSGVPADLGRKTHKRAVSVGGVAMMTTMVTADVTAIQTVRDNTVKPYALYTIVVRTRDHAGREDSKAVHRRYSDFYALHEKVGARFPALAKLPFPSKKTFGNMDKAVLEKRRSMLDAYLKHLLSPTCLQDHPELVVYLEKFLDPASTYEAERSQAGSLRVMKAVGSVKNSVRTAASAVTSVPNNIMDTVMDGLSKAWPANSKGAQHAQLADCKVGASLDAESSPDNIPLRIVLLFMDEVFDLQERNQWLRRQIVAVLRQLIKAMLGDIVNRRIVDYFAQMTSPEKVASYLQSFKQSLWPDGYPAAPRVARDEQAKMRTRVVARAALFSSFSDEVRRVIGSETSKTGLMMLFDMLQHPVLNKRLALVIFEGFLENLFRDQDFGAIFRRLHSRSARVRDELRNSHRKYADLRR